MSHVTTVKTKVQFKDTSVLKEAINAVAAMHTTTMVVKVTPDRIDILDPRMQRFRKDSLFFEHQNGQWVMKNDDYSCVDLMQSVVSQLTQQYQLAGSRKVLRQHGFSVGAATMVTHTGNYRMQGRSYR